MFIYEHYFLYKGFSKTLDSCKVIYVKKLLIFSHIFD